MKIFRKIVCIFLTIMLVLAMIPNGIVLATESATEFAGGDGTVENPYLISTAEHLNNVRRYLTSNFKMINDIVFDDDDFVKGGDYYNSGCGWNPIGAVSVGITGNFQGVFDGNGHIIKNLTIKNRTNAGLFYYVSGTVKNLGMVKGNINQSTANNMDGGFITYYLEGGSIDNCYNTGDIVAENTHSDSNALSEADIGGLVGILRKGTISKCWNSGEITVHQSYGSGEPYTGGIFGRVYGEGSKILNCYNAGTIIGSYSGVAGIGNTFNYKTTVENCYNVGILSGFPIAGYGSRSSDVANNCYYLQGKSEGTESVPTPLSDNQAKYEYSFYGFDFENIWVLDPYANYPYPQLRDNIQDLSPAVELVRLVALPEKLDYISGEALDLTGGMLEIVYKSGKSEMKLLTDDMVTGFDTENVSEQELTVTYGGKSDTFNVYVDPAPTLTGIRLYSEPDTVDFVIGTVFDFTGAKIERIYDNNTTDTIPITDDMVSGGNINHLGRYTITVSYKGFETSFRVTVSGLTLGGIRIDALPDKITYNEGEEFNPDGFKLTAVYNGNTEKTVETGYEFSGFSSEIGKHTITVSYLGKSADFEITVLCPHKNITQHKAVASTCKVCGNGEYYTCDKCGKVVSGSNEELPLAPHTFDNALDTECNVCGFTRKTLADTMLAVKLQITNGTKLTDDFTYLRFVSTIDNLNDYSEVGFYITMNGKTLRYSTSTVYSVLVGSDGETEINYKPTDWDENSKYFITYTLKTKNANFGKEINVTAFAVMKNGTEVKGTQRDTSVEALVDLLNNFSPML